MTATMQRVGVARFHLVHIPPEKAPEHTQVLLHGHTHVPRDETDAAGVRWLKSRLHHAAESRRAGEFRVAHRRAARNRLEARLGLISPPRSWARCDSTGVR